MNEKEQLRRQIERDTKRFIMNGGKVSVVPSGHSEQTPKTFSDMVWQGIKEQAKDQL